MKNAKTISTVTLPTPSRGNTEFIISQCSKGLYWAHELGNVTQWGEAMGTGERKAHRINPSKRFGNQYGKYWRTVGFKTMQEAEQAIKNAAAANVTHH
jgi:hypothetical protein